MGKFTGLIGFNSLREREGDTNGYFCTTFEEGFNEKISQMKMPY